MEFIWHGTASIEIVGKNGRILFDPFVPYPGSSVDVSLREFDGFSDILVTHGHFDHIASIPEIVKRNPTVKIHATATPCASLRALGVPAENLREFRIGDAFELNGFAVRTYQGKHAVIKRASAKRVIYALRSRHRRNLPRFFREDKRCPENGETVFYLLEAEGLAVAVMGSLNLEEGVDYPVGADLLALPYNGWPDNLPVAERVIRRLMPGRVVLHHFDDAFPPLTMPVNTEAFRSAHPDLVRIPALREALHIVKKR